MSATEQCDRAPGYLDPPDLPEQEDEWQEGEEAGVNVEVLRRFAAGLTEIAGRLHEQTEQNYSYAMTNPDYRVSIPRARTMRDTAGQFQRWTGELARYLQEVR